VTRLIQTKGLFMTMAKLVCGCWFVPDVRPTGNQRGESYAALFEGPDGLPGKEGLMITGNILRQLRTIHRHNAHAFAYVLEAPSWMRCGAKGMTRHLVRNLREGPSDLHSRRAKRKPNHRRNSYFSWSMTKAFPYCCRRTKSTTTECGLLVTDHPE